MSVPPAVDGDAPVLAHHLARRRSAAGSKRRWTVWQLQADVNRDQFLSACTLLCDAEDPPLPMRLARAAS